MWQLESKPGHRFEYVVSDADRWMREPEPTHTVHVRQAADGDKHSASTEWDYVARVLPLGLLQVSGDMEHDPTYRPLFCTLADFEVPTDTIAELCAVLDRFGIVDATDRETPDMQAGPNDRLVYTVGADTVTAARIDHAGRTAWEVVFTDDANGLRVIIDPAHVRTVYTDAAPLVAALEDIQPDTVPEVPEILARLGFTDTTERPARRVVTVVATVDLGGVPRERAESEIRDALARLGAALVPCNWAPDPDTIADATGADRVDVLDLNPGRG